MGYVRSTGFIATSFSFSKKAGGCLALSLYVISHFRVDNDCPVPVDKHGSVIILPHSFDISQVVKDQMFKFRNN